MCGIVGFASSSLDYCTLERMNRIQGHRGPDAQGIYNDPRLGVYFGMSRLAVIDELGGKQPMASSCGNFVIVYNGEIFNSVELRDELTRKGVVFRTLNSDTEVILELYIKKGAQTPKFLNGMFAFAILDRRSRTIFCCRDQLGIKPLFYTIKNGEFFFASEIKALRTLPFISDDLDHFSISEYFAYQRVTDGRTVYNDIASLNPGESLTYYFTEKTHSIQPFWKPLDLFTGEGMALSEEKFNSILRGAVKRWIKADVPVAYSLSGGLDSATIVAIAASLESKPLDTFTLGFDELTPHDERANARLISKYLGTNHTEIVLSERTFLSELDDIIYTLDEPYAGGVPSWFLYKAISKRFKVAVTGVGGDELLGNYNKWAVYERYLLGARHLINFIRRVNSKIKFDHFSISQILYRPNVFYPHEKSQLFLHPSGMVYDNRLKSALVTLKNARDGIALYDLSTQLPHEFLFMTDRFSMRHSLEVRTPFLDIELLSEVFRSDVRKSMNSRDYKGLLRQTACRYLPSDIIDTPKKGFVVPYEKWLKNSLRWDLKRLTSREFLQRQGIFQHKGVSCLVDSFLSGDRRCIEKLHTLFMFQKWYDLNFS